MQLQDKITRENIKYLMRMFYERALNDDIIGPIFIHELGEDIQNHDWQEHIELLADFWLAKILGMDTYSGVVSGTHVQIPNLKRESFTRWMELFSRAADEVYPPEISKLFKDKGLFYSEEFMRDIGI